MKICIREKLEFVLRQAQDDSGKLEVGSVSIKYEELSIKT